MEGRCAKHPFEASENTCRSCGNSFCADCLVYSFGPKKPPFCIACALAAAGVRSTAGNTPIKPKKEIDKETRQQRKAEKQSKKQPGPPVEIDWTMPADPTEGLTEDDLLLPEAQAPAPAPPPPHAPPHAPAHAPEGARPDAAPGPPPDRSDLPTASESPYAEPPQYLLRQAEVPMPTMPGMEPPAPPPPPPPPPVPPPPPAPPPPPQPAPPDPPAPPTWPPAAPPTSPATPSPSPPPDPPAPPPPPMSAWPVDPPADPVAAPPAGENHHIGPADLFTDDPPVDARPAASSFGLDDAPWATQTAPTPRAPEPARPSEPAPAAAPIEAGRPRDTWADDLAPEVPVKTAHPFVPLAHEEPAHEDPADELPPNWPNV